MKLWNKDIIIIIIVGLIIRLILLPYTQTVHADAISRIIHAQDWLENPRYIAGAVWGPLNQYLFGFAIKFMGGKVLGPKLINILFAVFTSYPLYWFSRNTFKTRTGAILVACIYTLSPLVIRNSFQALPAVPFAFFLALSMYYLSKAITENKINYLIFSGLAINFAGALRYEAWIISFLFGGLLLMQKQYRSFLVFGAIASLFPISWLIGNQVVFNDWFYSFHYSTDWAHKEITALSNVDPVELLKRILFFPFSVFIVFSPIVMFLLLYILPRSIIKKSITKKQLMWFIPFLVLFSIYEYKAITGTLLLQNKYTIGLLVLLIPFAALLFVQTKKFIKVLSIIGVAAIIPVSLVLNKIPWKNSLDFSSTLSLAVHDLFIEHYPEPFFFPSLRDKTFHLMVEKSQANYKNEDGLVTDFLDWENTYYYALHVEKTPYIISGTLHEEIKFEELETYFINHPTGLILLNYFGRLLPYCKGSGDTIKIADMMGKLQLNEVKKANGYMLFRYNYLSTPSQSFSNQENSIIDYKKDAEYFIIKINRDLHWLRSLEDYAKKEHKDLNTVIKETAEYCVDMGYD